MRSFFTLCCLLLATVSFAQTKISGQVLDAKGKPLNGCSVSLDNTLDGTSTDSSGQFHFTTTETGAQTLVVTNIGYESGGKPLDVKGDIGGIVITLRENAHSLDNVTITAGAFEASNDKAKAVLTTMDIITTAGANADVVKAIQTLPGTQQSGNQTGLFVRGGDASEAAVIVDGLIAQNAFNSSAPGVAARSRFSPFQVKGVSFSSGGYSARFGQALSSVLELNTLDFADKTTINAGINMAGIYFSGDKLWKQSSGSVTAFYNNLSPFYGLATTNVDYYEPPQGGGGSAKYCWKPNKDGMIKLMVNGTYYRSGVTVPNPDSAGNTFNYGIANTNIYSNISWKQMIKSKWSIYTAASYSYNKDDINAGYVPINDHDDRAQFRFEVKRFTERHFSLLVGTEVQHFSYNQDAYGYTNSFTENQIAGYAEAEWNPSRIVSVRPGLRYEHSALLNQDVLAPRLSIAIRTGKYSQIGLAGGSFYQTPDVPYLLRGYRPDMQQAWHYIANFQYIKNDRTFRLEAYYKDYESLVRDYGHGYDPNSYRRLDSLVVNNTGNGYAKGIELFWRDKKLVKNLDYWISYSYIDTRRFYKNYLTAATPDFISDHNLSLVAKYWIDKWKTQINMTYSYASGRPYYNPNNSADDFLADKTTDYHNLSFTVNYLTHIKKWFTVVYAGVDNVTNRKNVFGYRYTTDGATRYPQYPALFRSFFVGVNFSLTEFDHDEL